MGVINAELRKKIATAKATGGGNNIRDGEYLFEVTRVHSFKGFKATMFVAEFKVVEAKASLDPDAWVATPTKEDPNHRTRVEPNPVGSTCSMATPLDDGNIPNGPGNARAFVEALFGVNGCSDDEYLDAFDAVINEDPKAKDTAGELLDVNPAQGMQIRCITRSQVSKKSQKRLTLCNWTEVSLTPEQVAENRAAQISKKAA